MLQNKYFQVMKEFLKGYHCELYGSSFFKNVNISQKNISLILIELEKKGVLKSRVSGNRKYYSINFSNPLLRDYLVLFEYFRKIEFLEQNKKLIDFSKMIEGKIVGIFGSYAKNAQKKGSDLDIFIVGKVDKLKIKRIGAQYGYTAQVFNFSFADFKKNFKKDSILIQEILNNHVLLKGGDEFIKEVLQ